MYRTIKNLLSLLDFTDKKLLLKFSFVALVISFAEVLALSSIIPILGLILNDNLITGLSIKIIDFFRFDFLFNKTYQIFFFLIFIVVSYLLRIILTYYSLSFSFKLATKLNLNIALNTMSFDLQTFNKKNINTLSDDVLLKINFIQQSLNSIIGAIEATFLLVIFILIIIFINPIQGPFLILFVLIIYLFFGFILKRKIKSNSKDLLKSRNSSTKTFQEILLSFKEINLLGKKTFFFNIFEKYLSSYFRVLRNINLFNVIPKIAAEGIIAICLIITITTLDFSNTINYSNLIPILAFIGISIQRLIRITNILFSSYTTINSNSKLIYEISKSYIKIENKLKIDEFKRKIKFSSLSLKELSFNYVNSKRYIIKNLNFNLKKNDFILIKGKSGSGKSTLLNIISGLLMPVSGSYLINNKKFDYNKYENNLKISYIPQNTYLMNASIKENIAFGIDDNSIDFKLIKDVIKYSCLEEFISELEKGIDTHIGSMSSRISGGQKQRIAIARALYFNADVLIFDEATSNLDASSEKKIFDYLKFQSNKTIIVSSHSKQLNRYFDKIYTLKLGSLVLNKK